VPLFRPFAYPHHAVVNAFPRRLRSKRLPHGRVEDKSPISLRDNRPSALMHQTVMGRTLCRLSDYADFEGPGPLGSRERTSISIWAGCIIRSRLWHCDLVSTTGRERRSPCGSKLSGFPDLSLIA
jgi:hypothetical protein